MKKNIVLIIVIAAVLIGGGLLFFSGGKGQTSKTEVANSSSSLVADRQSHDFGTIDIFGGKVETDFTLANDGAEDVVVLAGTTSCGCTEGNLDGISFGMHEQMSDTVVIKAGESKNIKTIYDPLAHGPSATGPVTRQLFLKTNSEVTPEIEIRISANVVKNNDQ